MYSINLTNLEVGHCIGDIMPVSVKSYSEFIKKDVFTAKGLFCGKVSDIDLDLEKFRIRSIIVDAIKGSYLSSMVGDKRGVVIPFQMVQAVGDVIIIKHVQPTTIDSDEPETKK